METPDTGKIDFIEQLKRSYDRISRFYDLLDWPYEHFRYRKLRSGLSGDLSGHVLEAGVGTGRNLAYYPAGVRVTGFDLSEGQLVRARGRALKAAANVTLELQDVTSLTYPDDSFDACLSTFLFCVLPDSLQLQALRELARVVRPGGLIRILEYRYSDQALRRFGMRIMAPLTQTLFHARFDRDTETAISVSGLILERRRLLHADVLVAFDLRVPSLAATQRDPTPTEQKFSRLNG